MSLADLDTDFLKSITSLHSTEYLHTGEPSALQTLLEEAIKSKTGVSKDFTPLIATTIRQQRLEEFNTTIAIEESRTASSSDNELELDLLKEDLMCIVCNGMDVGARNRLLECSDCHALYHQECHKPVVVIQEAEDVWVCQSCKDSKQNEESVMIESSVIQAKSPSYVHRPIVNYKSSPPSNVAASPPSKSPVSSVKFSTNVNVRSTPDNMNKRIQIMKKKAAKMQEKRKLSH